MDETPWLDAAIEEAERGRAEGGIPIGSGLAPPGRVGPLEPPGRRAASVYQHSVIVTTLSPCAMCTGAILLYGIPHVVVGENRSFMGEEALRRALGGRLDVDARR